MVPKCKHCRNLSASRPRGLCWGCYYNPGVKELYPSKSKFAIQGLGMMNKNAAPLPPFPTDALPGTVEKLKVIQRRLLLNQCLWHPDDATFENAVGPWIPASSIFQQETLAHAA
jgi:hypothetical protein